MSSARGEISSLSEEDLGKRIFDSAVATGIEPLHIESAVRSLMRAYQEKRSGSYIPEMFHSSYQKRMKKGEVSLYEFLGHALRTSGDSYEVIKEAYARSQGASTLALGLESSSIIEPISALVGAMLSVSGTYLFLSKAEAENTRRSHSQAIQAYKRQTEQLEDTRILGRAAEEKYLENFFGDPIQGRKSPLPEIYDRLISSLAGSLNKTPEGGLMTSNYRKAAVTGIDNSNVTSWETLTALIKKFISQNSEYRKLFLSPDEWPDNTQNYVRKQVQTDLIARNLKILDNEVYQPQPLPFDENMRGAFKKAQDYEQLVQARAKQSTSASSQASRFDSDGGGINL